MLFKEINMYELLSIRTKGKEYEYVADQYQSIYEILRYLNYSHEEADDIASWSQLASLGDEYESTKREIEISIIE
jgi:ubiquitin C-terminal hydrolase